MPFTGSHPAAVLPLLRLGVPVSALVIGSLAPDLPYYLPIPYSAAQTHTLSGVFGVDLVIGLVAFLVWHLLLVQPMVWIAPAAVQRRIPTSLRGGLGTRLTTPGDLGRVAVGLSIGALTHVVWDSFTHAGMWGQRNVPWLSETILAFPLYRWLQLVSSVAGLAAIGWFAARWWRTSPAENPADPVSPPVRWGLAAVLLGWAGAAAVDAVTAVAWAPGRASREALLIEALLEFFSTLAQCLIVLAVAWHLLGVLRKQHAHVGA